MKRRLGQPRSRTLAGRRGGRRQITIETGRATGTRGQLLGGSNKEPPRTKERDSAPTLAALGVEKKRAARAKTLWACRHGIPFAGLGSENLPTQAGRAGGKPNGDGTVPVSSKRLPPRARGPQRGHWFQLGPSDAASRLTDDTPEATAFNESREVRPGRHPQLRVGRLDQRRNSRGARKRRVRQAPQVAAKAAV